MGVKKCWKNGAREAREARRRKKVRAARRGVCGRRGTRERKGTAPALLLNERDVIRDDSSFVFQSEIHHESHVLHDAWSSSRANREKKKQSRKREKKKKGQPCKPAPRGSHRSILLVLFVPTDMRCSVTPGYSCTRSC